ncbi:MAG: hypothetical protein QXP27_03275 [Candidatus Methanomethyliaceae archaeon]
MRPRRILHIMLLASILTAGLVSPSLGQSATNQTWTSSITYYTPSETSGTLQISYYASNGTSYSANPITLAPHKAGTLFIGSVGTVPDPFSGAAVLSSDVPVVATYVQFAAGSAGSQYGRIIYTGFSPDNAASTFYIPTILYDPPTTGSTSMVGVQNIESFAASVTLEFYAVGATSPTATKTVVIPAQSSYIFRPGDISGLTPGFSGSLVIKGVKQDDPSTPARVVASSIETDNAGRGAYGFEGFASGANKIFMASMLCKAGSDQQTSYYAIQNAGTINASVTITYYNTAGSVVGTLAPTNIPPGGKLSTNPCAAGVPAGTSGSAVIESIGAPVIAIGKVKASNGMATAFVGQAQGYTKVALPYVRWAATSTTDFRTFIAIMNVGSAPATDIRVRYYDGNGTMVAEHRVASNSAPLNPYIKTNSNPQVAGALSSGQFGFNPPGGAVEIVSDQPVVVVARAQRDVSPPLGSVSRFAEDYNGIPIP